MKKFLLNFFVFLTLFLFVGCDEEKGGIIFSKSPFSHETQNKIEGVFKTGEKIYYAVYNPKGFQTRLLKLQVFKKESEKSEFWGYEYLYNRTLELKDRKAFTDFVVIHNSGFYIFQIFDFTDFQKPVAIGIVKVE